MKKRRLSTWKLQKNYRENNYKVKYGRYTTSIPNSQHERRTHNIQQQITHHTTDDKETIN